jgi:hypothetical protein
VISLLPFHRSRFLLAAVSSTSWDGLCLAVISSHMEKNRGANQTKKGHQHMMAFM